MSDNPDVIIAKAKAAKAVSHVMRAVGALNDVNLALFPQLRDAVATLGVVETNLRLPIAEPRKVKMTAFVMSDTRDWDDPLIVFIETLSPDFFLDDVKQEYWKLFNPDELVDLGVDDYWRIEGARVWMVMPGHVQVGAAAVGSVDDVDHFAIENAFDESALRGL